jgi:hypothetical protein
MNTVKPFYGIVFFEELIRNDEELSAMVRNSQWTWKHYRLRSIVSSQSGHATEKFWESEDGAYFRSVLEKKASALGVDTKRHRFNIQAALFAYVRDLREANKDKIQRVAPKRSART